MNEKYFRNKYRIDSARRPGWDYASSGYYFITIVTKDRECLFGEIRDGIMILNDMGRIVDEEWKRSFEIRRELIMDEFAIMPNHLHGIVYMDDMIRIDRDDEKSVVMETDSHTHNETHSRASLRYRSPKSISSFVAGFKSVVTKRINEMRGNFGLSVWLPRFHDRIIRDETELFHVREYIKNNPINWTEDELKDAA